MSVLTLAVQTKYNSNLAKIKAVDNWKKTPLIP